MKIKKLILICICVTIFLIIISILYYKNQNLGNNISKSIKDFKQYILDISSYEATISVEIISNKNTNKYIIKQWYSSPNFYKQEVQEPENIKGLTTLYDGSNLEIKNSKLDLAKVYNNYTCLSSNMLDLSNFIEECKKNEPICTETENDITLEIKKIDKHIHYQKLIVDKLTCKPIKMEIMDENKKTLVYILYNDITINTQ